MSLFITRTQGRDADVLLLRGELDLATVGSLDDAFADWLEQGGEVLVIDLSALSFMDSTGLRSIMAAHERISETGRRLVAAAGSGPVARLIDLSGVGSTLDVRPSNPFAE